MTVKQVIKEIVPKFEEDCSGVDLTRESDSLSSYYKDPLTQISFGAYCLGYLAGGKNEQ